MDKIFLLLLSILIIMGCTNTSKETIMNDSLSYLALGDSYTIGESVPEDDRFPVILSNELNNLGIKTKHPRIIAKTGWTTDELHEAIVDSNITQTYDLVSLLIGVNNQYRGRDTTEYRDQYLKLLEMAIKFAKQNPKNVIVLSIPDWSVIPFAEGRDLDKIAKEIDIFNTIKKDVTESKGVSFIEITSISRLGKTDSNYIASDGLHFSGDMHQLWVNEIIGKYFKK